MNSEPFSLNSIVKTREDGYNFVRCSGRGAARLARLHGVQEVGGSNPLAPTTVNQRQARAPVFLFMRLDSLCSQILSPRLQ